jgi:hypothetical protein
MQTFEGCYAACMPWPCCNLGTLERANSASAFGCHVSDALPRRYKPQLFPLAALQISTGLDSATTFDICNRLRALCHTIKVSKQAVSFRSQLALAIPAVGTQAGLMKRGGQVL